MKMIKSSDRQNFTQELLLRKILYEVIYSYETKSNCKNQGALND